MFPVPSFQDVSVNWTLISGFNFPAYGFFLYTLSDREFPDYIETDGLSDLEGWTNHSCGLFILCKPNSEWINYAETSAHEWSDLMRGIKEQFGGESNSLDVASIDEVFAICLNQYSHKLEIASILREFGIEATAHPCLIFFKDLGDKEIWFVDLQDLLKKPVDHLRNSLKDWFGGNEFSTIVK